MNVTSLLLRVFMFFQSRATTWRKLWGERDTDVAYVLRSELEDWTIQLEKCTGMAKVVIVVLCEITTWRTREIFWLFFDFTVISDKLFELGL